MKREDLKELYPLDRKDDCRRKKAPNNNSRIRQQQKPPPRDGIGRLNSVRYRFLPPNNEKISRRDERYVQ